MWPASPASAVVVASACASTPASLPGLSSDGTEGGAAGSEAQLAPAKVMKKLAENGGRVSAEAGSFGRKGGSFTWGKAYEGGLDLRIAASALDVDGQDLFYPEYAGCILWCATELHTRQMIESLVEILARVPATV